MGRTQVGDRHLKFHETRGILAWLPLGQLPHQPLIQAHRRLVAADPQLVDDLRRVVTELHSALADADAPQCATITVQATTFGTSRVNQAGHDLYVTTGE
ncbi:MAG: hypothetical protein ACRDQ4_25815 [Pseudonocardiaceae bacterium]